MCSPSHQYICDAYTVTTCKTGYKRKWKRTVYHGSQRQGLCPFPLRSSPITWKIRLPTSPWRQDTKFATLSEIIPMPLPHYSTTSTYFYNKQNTAELLMRAGMRYITWYVSLYTLFYAWVVRLLSNLTGCYVASEVGTRKSRNTFHTSGDYNPILQSWFATLAFLGNGAKKRNCYKCPCFLSGKCSSLHNLSPNS